MKDSSIEGNQKLNESLLEPTTQDSYLHRQLRLMQMASQNALGRNQEDHFRLARIGPLSGEH